MNDAELMEQASQAKMLMDNPMYGRAWENVRTAIISLIERTPLSETQTAEDLRRCLKLLRDVRANVELAMNQGKIIEFRLQEAKERSQNRFKGLFR